MLQHTQMTTCEEFSKASSFFPRLLVCIRVKNIFKSLGLYSTKSQAHFLRKHQQPFYLARKSFPVAAQLSQANTWSIVEKKIYSKSLKQPQVEIFHLPWVKRSRLKSFLKPGYEENT